MNHGTRCSLVPTDEGQRELIAIRQRLFSNAAPSTESDTRGARGTTWVF
jgi:hypothetical protein